MRLLLVTGLIHKKVTLMAHIDYFFATISPFTYLAGTEPRRDRAKTWGNDRLQAHGFDDRL